MKLIALLLVLLPSIAKAQPAQPPPSPTPAVPVPAPASPVPTSPAPPSPTYPSPAPAARIQPPDVPPCPAPTLSSEEVQTMLSLLERMDRVVSDARGEVDPAKVVGTSGSSPGSVKVTMDVSALDEIRAEIGQLQKTLQPIRQP